MSTLRISNIEAKADVSSPTVDEKVKITNSQGAVLMHLDGKTSGITTVGINTTAPTLTVSGNNVTFAGIVTATGGFSGNVNATGVSTFSQLNVGTGGTVITTTAGGLVGVGTTNPTLNSKVEIYGTDANLQVHYANNTRGGIAALSNQRLAIYTTAAADHIVFGRSTTDATAISGTNFTEHVRINNTTGNTGIGTDSPDTNLHIQRSSAPNDTHGILKIESTNSTSGAATNSSLIVKNKYGWSQFMQWENYGLRVGSRNITGGSSGGIYFTYGADNEGIILDSSGRVRMPSQPSGAWALTVNGSGVRSVSIKKNTGNHVSSVPGGNGSTHGSVGRFTAPVNGAYLISLFSTAVGASSQCLMSVYGSWTSATNNVAVGAEVFDCRSTRPPEDGGGWSQVFYFNATDYWEIDWYRPSATAYIDSVMTMNVTVHLLG